NIEKKEETGKTEKTEKPGKKGDNTEKTQSGETKTSQSAIVKKYTAKFYSLKAYYMGQLSGLEAQAKRDYAALSKEQRKSVSKVSFAAKYMNYALALEGECDGQMETLLSQMKSELEAVGGDTSIIGTIRQAYQAEKAAKKAGYMSLLG
ncbi:MAG: hypothetical protein Q4G23_05660, partial [Clostridia bacterium]|nr:hypothetical protein [Clostridia bacterium]